MKNSAIKHFAGSRECSITQDDIYLAPWPLKPKVSPFCKNRATLLEALSGGGRHGWDEPYVGRGKWTRQETLLPSANIDEQGALTGGSQPQRFA